MGFPRQEYWSGLPFPPPGIELMSPALAGVFFTTRATYKYIHVYTHTHTPSFLLWFITGYWILFPVLSGFPGGSDGKASACNVRDPALIPGWGRSPGEGNGNPLQYSCLENFHGMRLLVGCSPWGLQRHVYPHTHTYTFISIVVFPGSWI